MWAARPAPPLPQRGGQGARGMFPVQRAFLGLQGGTLWPWPREEGVEKRWGGLVPSWSAEGGFGFLNEGSGSLEPS